MSMSFSPTSPQNKQCRGVSLSRDSVSLYLVRTQGEMPPFTMANAGFFSFPTTRQFPGLQDSLILCPPKTTTQDQLMTVEGRGTHVSPCLSKEPPGSRPLHGFITKPYFSALSIYLSPLWLALPGKVCFLFLLSCLQVSLCDLEAIPWRWWTHAQVWFPRVLCGSSTQANESCRMCVRKKFQK